MCKHEKKLPFAYFPGSLLQNMFPGEEDRDRKQGLKHRKVSKKQELNDLNLTKGSSKNPAVKIPIQTPVRKRRLENLKSQTKKAVLEFGVQVSRWRKQT